MEEIWKDIIGYEGRYQVSTLGRVRNIKTGRILKPSLSGGTYLKVNFTKYNQPLLHRLVAKTFIPNADNKPIYDKNFEVFKKLYKSNKDNFAALNATK